MIRKNSFALHYTMTVHVITFLVGKLFSPVWMSDCWLRVMTIASSLMGEYGLSHEIVEDGCKSACVKFGGSKPNRTGDMVSLMHVKTKSDYHRKIIYLVMG